MLHMTKSLRHATSAAALALLGLAATPALAWSLPQLAGLELEEMDGVGIEQKLGDAIPLDAKFQSDTGAFVELGDSFGDVPVLLTLNYIDCPLLCSFHLETLVKTMAGMDLEFGVDYRVVTLSIHPGDSVEQLAGQKARYVTEFRGLRQDAGEAFPEAQALGGWTFLRGTRAEIDRVADAVGFGYSWIPEKSEYAHSAPTIVCTQDGVVSRYFQASGGDPTTASSDFRLALVDASDGKIGTLLDALFLQCFRFDPGSGSYRLAFGMLRGAAAATLVALLAGLFFMRRPGNPGPPSAPGRSGDGDGPGDGGPEAPENGSDDSTPRWLDVARN